MRNMLWAAFEETPWFLWSGEVVSRIDRMGVFVILSTPHRRHSSLFFSLEKIKYNIMLCRRSDLEEVYVYTFPLLMISLLSEHAQLMQK